jgi:hypothetical protein
VFDVVREYISTSAGRSQMLGKVIDSVAEGEQFVGGNP